MEETVRRSNAILRVVLTTLASCFVVTASAEAIPIVIFGPTTNPANNHVYYLLSPDMWEESESAAVALGGHLVTINDLAENDWVFDTFASAGGVSRTLWTGYRRLEVGGSFSWVSGEAPGFENWADGEPNGADEFYAAFVPPDQIVDYPAFDREWFDMYAGDAYYGGPINGVVEVDQAAVPEPGTMSLVLLGVTVAALRRERVRQRLQERRIFT
jgi:hypothetical protein